MSDQCVHQASASRFSLRHLSDPVLLDSLTGLVRRGNRLEAELLAHVAEVDRRRLYLGRACESMFAYCTEVLRLSEDAAYKRIQAARAAREVPIIFELVARGELHLSGVSLLAPRLTADNHVELLARAKHQSKRAIERLIAERFPQPDVPSSMRKLPTPRSRPAPHSWRV